MRGIYKITNKINGKMYIGESLDIIRRWEEHKEALKNNKHYNYKLQKDYNQYGLENFEFNIIAVLDESILEHIDKYILLIYESLNILKYNTIDTGYNSELTVSEILNGNKIVYSNKDKYILENCKVFIDNGRIKEIGGIIYTNKYKLRDIEKELNIGKDVLKTILTNNNILINEIGTKKFILNSDMFKEGIIINGSYSKIEIDAQLYNDILNIVKKYISQNDISSIEKPETIKKERKKREKKEKKIKDLKEGDIIENIEIDKYKIIDKYESKKYKTIKGLLEGFELNITYNDAFRFLRNSNVLEYKYFNNKKYNVPCSEYISMIFITIQQSIKGTEYLSLCLTKEAENAIYILLKENGFISD